jgi:hypothetical protein
MGRGWVNGRQMDKPWLHARYEVTSQNLQMANSGAHVQPLYNPPLSVSEYKVMITQYFRFSPHICSLNKEPTM